MLEETIKIKKFFKMFNKTVTLGICTVFISCLSGCGLLIQYPIQKLQEITPSSKVKKMLSDPVWSTDSKSIYFVQKEYPIKSIIVYREPNLMPFWLHTGYINDESRNVRYRLIMVKLITGKAIKSSILTNWLSQFKSSGDMLDFAPNFILSSTEKKFILKEYLYSKGLLRTTKINISDLTIEQSENEDLSKRKEREQWRKNNPDLEDEDLIYFPASGRYLNYQEGIFTVYNSSQEVTNKIYGRNKDIKFPIDEKCINFSPDNSKIVFRTSVTAIYLIDLDKNEINRIYSL